MERSIFCKNCLVSVVCREGCERITTIHKILVVVDRGSIILFILSGMIGVIIVCLNFVDDRTHLPIITIIQLVLTMIIMACIKLKSTLDVNFNLNE